MNARLKAEDASGIKGLPKYNFVKRLDIGRFTSLSLTGPFDFFVEDGLKPGVYVTAEHESDIDYVAASIGFKEDPKGLRISGQLTEKRDMPRQYFQSNFTHYPQVLLREFGELVGIIRPQVLPRRRIAVGVSAPHVSMIRLAGMASLSLILDIHDPLDLHVTGRNTVKLVGSATTLRLMANGSCDVDGRNFFAEFAQVVLYKRGRLMLNVMQSASVKLHGHGEASIRPGGRHDRLQLTTSIRGPGTVDAVVDWPLSCGPWLIPPPIIK
jgi:hypothetical protein